MAQRKGRRPHQTLVEGSGLVQNAGDVQTHHRNARSVAESRVHLAELRVHQVEHAMRKVIGLLEANRLYRQTVQRSQTPSTPATPLPSPSHMRKSKGQKTHRHASQAKVRFLNNPVVALLQQLLRRDLLAAVGSKAPLSKLNTSG